MKKNATQKPKQSTKKETPMAKQWREMRSSLPEDVLLFFRLGDFYELFDEDAERAAHLLELTLTKRSNRSMCGVPHHAARDYIARALKHGFRVALAEQKGEVKAGKLVEREIAQILSAGSVLDEHLLSANEANWLVAVSATKPSTATNSTPSFGFAALEHSTGAFELFYLEDEAALQAAIARFRPAEIIYPETQRLHFASLPQSRLVDEHSFAPEAAKRLLCEHFSVQSLTGFGLSNSRQNKLLISAGGAVLHYLRFILRQQAKHLRPPHLNQESEFLQLDAATQRNLELVQSSAGKKHSLFGILEQTQTASGARLLQEWLLSPSFNESEIRARQDLVAALVDEPSRLSRLRQGLKLCRDMERSSSRLAQGQGNARHLAALRDSLAILPAVVAELEELPHLARARTLHAQLPSLPELNQALSQSLAQELPLSVREGGLFQSGYHPELDELRAACEQGQAWLAQLQEREAQESGIKNLKLKYNSVFGYFLEVSKSNLDKVPPAWVRKQTTANAERYITEELKTLEDKILGAQQKAFALEYQLFEELRAQVLTHLPALQGIAQALAQLDVLSCFATLATERAWVQPEIVAEPSLEIQAGRHPVLDLLEEEFVPNDTELNPETRRLILLTGPNMAGKSTYIRQNALLLILAQMGSFVPADFMRFGLVDRIFARVGASDNLAQGQSTFMVEMTEAAAILHQATEKSLVILDEIGRGTATWDGLSLAWSIAEHLHDKIQARTLFATHYHEITQLTQRCKAMQNAQVSVREAEGKILFLYQITQGSADKSYGIQVARLAGLPEPVLKRATSLLQVLEQEGQALVLADDQFESKPPSKRKSQAKTKAKTKKQQNKVAEPEPDLFS